MWRTELKLAWRAISSRRGITLLNVSGLAVGVAGCLLILLFVQNELSFDRFHARAARIHRVALDYHVGATRFESAIVPSPLAAAVARDYPEVESAARIFRDTRSGGRVWVKRKGRSYREENFLWADPEIFKVFSFDFLDGDPRTALDRPGTLVLTPAAARKYFGDKDPMGRVLDLSGGASYQVTGLVRPFPATSHVHFDFLASFSTLKKSRDPEWYDTAVFTYLLLKEGVDAETLAAKLPDLSRKYAGPVIEKAMGTAYEAFLETGNRFGFFLQPLTRIHFHSALGNEFEPNGNLTAVLVFAAAAFLILLVACANFINLSTARSAQRAVEVGMRKVVGSTRGRVMRQFLLESMLICAAAVFLAVFLVGDVLPLFNVHLGRGLSTTVVQKWYAFPGLIGLVVLVGALAGAYPAFTLAAVSPAAALRARSGAPSSGRRFRRSLVVFQFVTSIVLLAGSLLISSQLNFMREKPPGFQREGVVVIQGAARLGAKQPAFKQKLLKHPGVQSVTRSDSLQQVFLETKVFQLKGAADHQDHTLITVSVDDDFFPTYRIKLLEGRSFDSGRPADREAVLLNRSAVRALGIDKPLESHLILMGRGSRPLRVIGVFDDYHVESLHAPVRPMAALPLGKRPSEFISVRTFPRAESSALGIIDRIWKAFHPDGPLETISFDEIALRDYASEIRAGKILASFTALAVFVACLGLFGLASFTTERRTREIGLRRTLGATLPGLVSLLVRDFGRWVLAANLIACPLAYLFMHRWLQSFAYRTRIGVMIFFIPLVVSLLVALVAVAWQSVRAALTDPVTALRYE